MMKDTPNGQTHHAMCWKEHHECAKTRIETALQCIQDWKDLGMENGSVSYMEHILQGGLDE